VSSISFVAYDERDIAWIAFNRIVDIDPDPKTLQFCLKGIGAVLSGILGDHYASYKKASVFECVDKTEYINIIGDPQISSDFVFFNISGTDHDDDFRMI